MAESVGYLHNILHPTYFLDNRSSVLLNYSSLQNNQGKETYTLIIQLQGKSCSV